MSFEEQVFQPQLLPRQGEINAWILAFIASLALALLQMQGVVPIWSWILVLFLFFSAFSISLGNWMDRRTVLRLAEAGIFFENGLRRVQLAWSDIHEVRILPARWGQRVQVLGKEAHFEFSTAAEVKFQGEIKGRVGFLQDKKILEVLLQASSLTHHQKTEKYVYYSRL
jgi:hypothetical protein